jgi:hypothetical protein
LNYLAKFVEQHSPFKHIRLGRSKSPGLRLFFVKIITYFIGRQKYQHFIRFDLKFRQTSIKMAYFSFARKRHTKYYKKKTTVKLL